jgi:hypothetical protein
MLTATLSLTLVYSVGVPVAVAILTATATLLINHVGAAADRRRDHYAQAVQTLVAWVEFPYRIRRRTNDSSETIGALADLGHDIQERLACHEAWIGADRPRLAEEYARVRGEVGALVGPAAEEAWTLPPVGAPAGMNLGEWGPGAEAKPLIAELQLAIERRPRLRRRSKRGQAGT